MKFHTTLFFLFLTQMTFAQLPKEIQDNIHQRMEYGYNPSIAIGIIDSSGTTFYSFGKADLEIGEAVDENTIYEIGSISKVFTGWMLAEMITEGKMNLDDPIEKYLPTIKVPDYQGVKITLKDLSTHYSSLPRLPDNLDLTKDLSNPYANYDGKALLEFLEKYKLTREPGTVYEYSNYAVGLLGYILAKENGMSYEELFKEKIGKKLGVKNTTITLSEVQKKNMAMGYMDDTVVSNWDFDALAGAGAWRSNVNDMLQVLAAHLKLEGNDLTPAAQLTQELHMDNGTKMGLGWHFYKDDIRWHNGGTGGYRSFCGIDVKKNRGVVVLTNSSSGVDDIGLKILDPTFKLQPVKKITEIDDTVFSKYVGEYILGGMMLMTVSQEEKKYLVQMYGQPAYQIFPESETKFFLKVVNAQIEFVQDEKGNFNSLMFEQNGMRHEGKRKKK